LFGNLVAKASLGGAGSKLSRCGNIAAELALALPICPHQCENHPMRKLSVTPTTILAVGILLMGNALAQQTPASTTKPATTAKPGTTAAAHTSTAAKSTQTLTLKTQKDKVSYAIGMNIGQGMKKDSVDIDPAILERGLKDALTGAKPLMTEAEAVSVMTDLRNQMTKKKEAEAQQMGTANKQAGQQFLAANKTKEGVVTLPSGLQYKVLKEGTGPKPTAADTVVCNYRGTLIDGKEFDSSFKRGQPATFPVGQVIKGWTEALQLMPVGSKWQLFVPADLAYGERSPSPDIGPNATLIFDIDLLSIQEKKPQESKP
jgi:FKBP-type peptidyl-prolyl cis-trans isomerase